MSIASEIERLENAKNALKEALIAQGQAITSDLTIDKYVPPIENIFEEKDEAVESLDVFTVLPSLIPEGAIAKLPIVDKIREAVLSGLQSDTISIPFVGEEENGTISYPFGYLFGELPLANTVKAVQNIIENNTVIGTKTYYIPETLKKVIVYGYTEYSRLKKQVFSGLGKTNIKSVAIRGKDSWIPKLEQRIFDLPKLEELELPTAGTTRSSSWQLESAYPVAALFQETVDSEDQDKYKAVQQKYKYVTNFSSEYKNISGYVPKSLKKIIVSGNNYTKGSSGIINETVPPYAFANMDMLEEIELSDQIEYVEEKAFLNCDRLKKINIPFNPSFDNYGDESPLADCKALEQIIINPADTHYILNGGCLYRVYRDGSGNITSANLRYSLKNKSTITISTSLPNISISKGAFAYLDINELIIPSNVTSIASGAFYNTHIGTLRINANISSISSLLNYTGTIIDDIYFGESFESFGNYTVGSLKAQSIHLPSTLTSISSNAFSYMQSLKNVYIDNNNPTYTTFGSNNCIVERSTGNLILLTQQANLVIPEGVVSIDSSIQNTFDSYYGGLSAIKSITLPTTLQSIGSNAFYSAQDIIEIYNKSPLTLTIGGTDNGYIAKNALNIYDDNSGSSKLITRDNFLRYEDNGQVVVVSYVGDSTTVTLPSDTTTLNSYAFNSAVVYDSITIPVDMNIKGSAFGSWATIKRLIVTKDLDPTKVTNVFSYNSINPKTIEYIEAPTFVIKGIFYGQGDQIINEANTDAVINSMTPDNTIAFCHLLKSVSFSNELMSSITSLPSQFMYNDRWVTNITLPTSLETIDSSAFSDCFSFTTITIPASVTTINNSAFYNCRGLTSVIFETGSMVETIGNQAFAETKLISLTIPATVTSLGRGFVANAPIETLNIFANISNISLGSLYSLKYLTLPASLTTTSYQCNLPKLEELHFAGTLTQWLNITTTNYGNAFFADNEGKGKLFVNMTDPVIDVEIPEGVTSINAIAFYNNQTIKSVHISSTVTNIAANAFYGCKSITTLSVAAGNSYYDSRDNCNAIIYKYNNSNTLVVGCKNTIIPQTVTTINQSAFAGSGLLSITIPSNVTSINSNVFSDCKKLLNVLFVNPVNSVYGLFRGCTSLSTMPANISGIGDYMFSDCTKMTELDFSSITGTSVGQYAFANCGTQRLLPESNILCFDLSNTSITSVGNYAFNNLIYSTIKFPTTLTTLSASAFFDATNTSVYFTSEYAPTLTANLSLKDTTCKLLIPYNYIDNYKTAAYWNHATDNMAEYLDVSGMSVGDPLPSFDSKGYELIWYDSLDYTNIITTVPNNVDYVYCINTGIKVAASFTGFSKDCAPYLEDQSSVKYYLGNPVPLNQSLTLGVEIDGGNTEKYLLNINGQDYDVGDTITVSNDLILNAIYYDGITSPVDSTLSNNDWDLIKAVSQSGKAGDIWSVGDTKTFSGKDYDGSTKTYTVRLADTQVGRYKYTNIDMPTHVVFELLTMPNQRYYLDSTFHNYPNTTMNTETLGGTILPMYTGLNGLLESVDVNAISSYSSYPTSVMASNKLFLPSMGEIAPTLYSSYSWLWDADLKSPYNSTVYTPFDYYTANDTTAARRKNDTRGSEGSYFTRTLYSNNKYCRWYNGDFYSTTVDTGFYVGPCFAW